MQFQAMRLPDEIASALGIDQHGAFARWQLSPRGVTADAIKHRLATGYWIAVLPGVYVLAGGGYYYIRTAPLGPNVSGHTSENRFGFHAGAGLDARVALRTSVHADLRYVILDVGGVQNANDVLGTSLRSNFWSGVAGVTFSF